MSSGLSWLGQRLPLTSLISPSAVPEEGLWVEFYVAGDPEQGGT